MIARIANKVTIQPTLITALISFIAVLPATIASISALMEARETHQKVEVVATKVEEVRHATNSMKDALVIAAGIIGKQQGIDEEKQRNKDIDAAKKTVKEEEEEEERKKVKK